MYFMSRIKKRSSSLTFDQLDLDILNFYSLLKLERDQLHKNKTQHKQLVKLQRT